jgi:hypothetical protein
MDSEALCDDADGRRIENDRRQFSYTLHIPERRCGKERRCGIERRHKIRSM